MYLCPVCCQIVMITEQISYEEKRDIAKQLQDKQVRLPVGADSKQRHVCCTMLQAE